MMRKAVMVMAVVLFASAGLSNAHAQTSGSADTRDREGFFGALQRASRSDDRSTISAMISYPIIITIGGFRVPFADSGGFLERYDDIFTPALRESIARGSADVVVETVNGRPRIVAITVPRGAGGGRASETAPADPSTGAARTPEPRRVTIRVRPRPTRISGSLAPDATDSLIVFLPKGRLASVRLERVPAGVAVISVVHARTGAPLGARVSANGRFVSGRPAEGADYRIDVRRTGNDDDEYLPYMLSLTLR